jgi:hypothetical protein
LFNIPAGQITPTQQLTVTVTPTPTAVITPTATPTFTPTATATPILTPTATPTLTPTQAIEPTATPTLTPTQVVEPTATPTLTPTQVVEPTATPTLTPTQVVEPTATPTLVIEPTAIPTTPPTATSTLTPTGAITPTATPLPTPILTPTATATPVPGDLAMTMTGDITTVVAGEPVTISLALTNTGATTLTGLALVAPLPGPVTYEASVGSPTPRYDINVNALIWEIDQMPAGQSLTLGYRLRVEAAPGPLTLSASAQATNLAVPRQAEIGLTVIAVTPSPVSTPERTRPQAGPPAKVHLGLRPVDDRDEVDGSSGYWLAVRVVDADDLPVENGTGVSLSLSNGSLETALLTTRGGQATARLWLPEGEAALLTAQAGEVRTGLAIDADSDHRPGDRFERRDDRYDPAADALAAARNRLEGAGNEAVAGNRARRASFDQAGLDYRFKVDVEADRAAGLAFALTDVRVGPTSLLPDSLAFSYQDNWAIYEAEAQAWAMAYEVSDEGVEQYFHFEDDIFFDQDLIIEGRFRTDLRAVLASDEAGIRFYLTEEESEEEAEEPVLGYGPAIVRDAEGNRITAHMDLQGLNLRLTIPARWLQRAEFPLIIDPVIGPAAQVSTLQGDTRFPAAASDATHFLTVWDWNGDIYGQLTGGDGENAGDLIAISQAEGTQLQAEVVYNPVSDDYLVAWEDKRYGAPNYSLFAQRVSITGTLIGEEIEVTDPHENLGFFGGVSGAVNQSGETLLVWSHTENGYDVFGQMLDSSGVLTGSVITLTTASDWQRRPDVAYDDQSDTFLVVWEDERGGSEFDLYAQHLLATGALSGSNYVLVDNSGPDAQNPDISANDNGQFLVVWQQELSGSDTDIYAQRVTASTGAAQGSTIDVGTGSGHDRYPTGIAISSTAYLLAWSEGSFDTHVRQIDSDGALLGAGSADLGQGHFPALAIDGAQALVVWEESATAGQKRYCGPATGPGRPGRRPDCHLSLLRPAREPEPGLPGPGPGDGHRLGAAPEWAAERHHLWPGR